MTKQLSAQKVRSRLFAILAGGGLALAGIVVILAFRGPPRLPTLTPEDFDAAVQKWRDNKPESYEITVQVTGRQPGTYHVQVRNRVAESASLDARPLRNRRTLGTWAVNGMFETIRRDLVNNAKHGYLLLRADFDPQLGFPSRYERIEVRTGAHDALQWEVIEFKPEENG